MKTLGVIGTFVAGAAVGFVTCGVLTVRGVIVNEKIRKAMIDVISDEIEEKIYTDRKFKPRDEKISYVSYYDREEDEQHVKLGRTCCFETREAAENVLSHMDDILVTHGNVRLSDFYGLCGVASRYMDRNVGWKNLDDATVIFKNDMYSIELPPFEKLDED